MKNARWILLSRLLSLVFVATASLAHAQPLPPTVATLPASAVGLTNATLNAVANTSGYLAYGFFEWGATTNYGNVTPAQSLGTGLGDTNFSQAVGGLSAGGTYHFRAVASNIVSVVFGTNQTVATYRNSSCFDFDNGQLPPGSVLLGEARITNGVVKLTEAPGAHLGSWILDDVNAGANVTGFDARFRLRIGNTTGGCHADGFSFVWARNLPDIAFGEEYHGGVSTYAGNLVVSNGLVVSFDTWSNGTDDPAPSVDVVYNGVVLFRQTNAFFIPDLFNTGTQFAPVAIRLSPDGRLNVEIYSYYYDYSVVAVTNLLLPGFSGLAGARFGWGARTGGCADDHFVDDICLSTIVPCPTPTLSINRSGTTNVVVTFTGTLQSAPAPTGSWTNVIGAVSPHVTSSTGQKYFRATSTCNGSP